MSRAALEKKRSLYPIWKGSWRYHRVRQEAELAGWDESSWESLNSWRRITERQYSSMLHKGLSSSSSNFALKLALCALCQDLGFQKTLSEAPFESILLSIWYVLALQHAVQTFNVNPLITCQETLQYKGDEWAVFTQTKYYFTIYHTFTLKEMTLDTFCRPKNLRVPVLPFFSLHT